MQTGQLDITKKSISGGKHDMKARAHRGNHNNLTETRGKMQGLNTLGNEMQVKHIKAVTVAGRQVETGSKANIKQN